MKSLLQALPTTPRRPSTVAVAVQNKSTILHDDEVRKAVAAFQTAADTLYTPYWGVALQITFVPDIAQASPHSYWMSILDDSTQQGALGFHDTSNDGQPHMLIFAKTDKQAGCSWQVTCTHELWEAATDPYCQACYFYQNTATTGIIMPLEVSDMVEADNLAIVVNGVEISNLVTPAWFDQGAPAGTKLDVRGVVKTPLTIAPGSYASVFEVSPTTKGWQDIFGDQPGARYLSKSPDYRTKVRARKFVAPPPIVATDQPMIYVPSVWVPSGASAANGG